MQGLEDLDGMEDLYAFHAGTARDTAGRTVTAGGRVFGITGVGDSIGQAIERAYAGARQVRFEGVYYRRDIGHRALRREAS